MPVLETLGGALFGAVLQVLFDRIDSRQVVDYFRGRKLDEKLLKKLKRKLVSINAVVDDAEQKQFRNAYVKAWLDEVRDVLLDTEDLMDEIHYEFSTYELEVESQGSSSKFLLQLFLLVGDDFCTDQKHVTSGTSSQSSVADLVLVQRQLIICMRSVTYPILVKNNS